MEAQGGWFSQFGYKMYELDLDSFETVLKSITAYGTSVLNIYMLAVNDASFLAK